MDVIVEGKSSFCNIYAEANLENLNALIKKGANIGIVPLKGIMSYKFIVTNAYGNLFGFNCIKDKPFLVKFSALEER